MPTIDVSLADLRALIGTDVTVEALERHLDLVKGELKRGASGAPDDLRIELKDTNRPDLWCVEGIARQIRQWLEGHCPWREEYGFLERPGGVEGRIEVDASVAGVRPFVGGFLARGWRVDDHGLRAFIQMQETLSRNFGRKRANVAIGIYDGARIRFPVRYEAVALDDRAHAFMPLPPGGDLPTDIPTARWDEPWTPGEILRDHPAGREFHDALGADRAPLLIDANGEVLSFPPIINSAQLGRVAPGMDVLFVEVTGRVLDHVLLALNILAASLRDRGAEIAAVATRYPFDTERGREVLTPHPLPEKRVLALQVDRFRTLLGEPGLTAPQVAVDLERYGLVVRVDEELLRVEAPPYRADYLHDVDAVEDFVISRGFAAFAPRMPEEFTVGRLAATTLRADTVRDQLIGHGFEECITNILTAEHLLRDAVRIPAEGAPPAHASAPVRIANVMNLNYSSLRDWLLPSLLQVESRSAQATYPHRIFEVGEVAVAAQEEALRSRTELRAAALVAHETASISEAQAFLNALLVHFRIDYTLTPAEHPSFLPGRFAIVRIAGRSEPVGMLGEIHPEVLAGDSGFGIRVPCAGFELSLAALG